jgi:hypothetical protein
MNSQAKIQDEINLHNQEKKAINASWMEMVRRTWEGQLQA